MRLRRGNDQQRERGHGSHRAGLLRYLALGDFCAPDSRIRTPEDLRDIPIAVGMRAGSHFNVPYRLEK